MGSIAQQALEEGFRNQLRDYASRYDVVSGLPNPHNFRSSLQNMLEECTAREEEIALLWLDVLNLRREFSVGGNQGVHRLVTGVVDSLRPLLEEGELICRYGDRCFLMAIKRSKQSQTRLNFILESVSKSSISMEGRPEVAGGVACFPEHATSAEELIRFASLAAVSASTVRSKTPILFHPEMNAALMHERDLERDLRIALRKRELRLVYQPQIDLNTGNILGVEGLTRWNHPTRGPVSPAHFIAVAEKSDLIDEIFEHSLHRLLSDAAKWQAAGVTLPLLAVNASAANVRHADFVSIVRRELDANPPIGSQLDVEVTESLMMDDEALFVERLNALRDIGVNVSLDDFGTRYTGFNALKGLPLNTMKIDRCFVHGVERSAQAQSLCRTIVTMADHLKLGTIAEGIESIEELRILKSLGCQGGQGYLFQRPVPSEEFLQFVKDWPERKQRSEFAGAFHDVFVDPDYEMDPLFGVA
jgi:EAL domain-containing protein (putative c-di-GMP-specific phosphodiesterase class I)/GGDEF domain-containing protein